MLASAGRNARRVATDPHPGTARHRLVGDQHRDVEQLLDRVGADHSRLEEQRVHRHVGARERAGVRGRGAPPGARAPALDRDDRLAAAHAARDLGEAARVPERLEVEQDHVRPRIPLPELEQVVARDVGLVADAHEVRDPDVELGRVLEDREPEGSALGRERDPPRGRIGGREGGVELDAGLGVDDAQAVGTDEPHAVALNALAQRRLARGPLGAGLLEAGADHHHRLDAVAPAGLDDREHVRRRDDDHGEIHRAGHVGDGRIGLDRLDHLGLGVHREDRAVESPAQQVVEDLGADRAAGARGADHRHRARPQDGFDGAAPARRFGHASVGGGCLRLRRRDPVHRLTPLRYAIPARGARSRNSAAPALADDSWGRRPAGGRRRPSVKHPPPRR